MSSSDQEETPPVPRDGDESAAEEQSDGFVAPWPEEDLWGRGEEEAAEVPAVDTEITGSGAAAAAPKEQAAAPWRTLTKDLLLPVKAKLTSDVWLFGRCVFVALSCAELLHSLVLSRMISPNALMGDGRTFHAAGKHFCCLLCLDAGKQPTHAMPKLDTTAAQRHMERVHPAEWATRKGSAAVRPSAADTDKQQKLAFAKAMQQPERMKSIQPYKLNALQRAIVAAQLVSIASYNSMTSPAHRFAMGMVSGLVQSGSGDQMSSFSPVYTPPSKETARRFEIQWEKEARANIKADLIADGILSYDGTPFKSALPLVSIAFDASSTTVDGYKAISLNIDWLDPKTATPKHANVAVGKFRVSSGNNDELVSQTGVNLATWVVEELKYFGLVPDDHTLLDIRSYIRGACTDNASAEVNAVVKQLKVAHQPCVCHSLELALKAAADPKISDADMNTYREEKRAAEAAGDAPPQDPRSVLSICLSTLAGLAKFLKKTTNTRDFYNHQASKGISEPMALISRSQTRWHMCLDMLWRAILLRSCLLFLFNATSTAPFSDNKWGAMCQSVAFLGLFKTAIVACQSGKQLLGDHMGTVLDAIDGIYHPHHLKMLRADFNPNGDFLSNPRNKNLDGVLNTAEFTTPATADKQLPETIKLVKRFRFQLDYRLGKMKEHLNTRQLNGIQTALAMLLHPGLKTYVCGRVNPETNTIVDVPNDLFTTAQKQEAVTEVMRLGRLLEVEMGRAAGPSSDSPADGAVHSPPRKKQAVSRAIDRIQSTVASMHHIDAMMRGIPSDDRTAFVKEWSEFRALALSEMPPAEWWCSDAAIHRFPILRRMFLSICSLRPDNAQSERDFSALTRLLSPMRRGRMRAETASRKMFLYLNRHYWHPCPEIKDTFYYKALLQHLGMDEWLVLTPDSDSDESGDELE